MNLTTSNACTANTEAWASQVNLNTLRTQVEAALARTVAADDAELTIAKLCRAAKHAKNAALAEAYRCAVKATRAQATEAFEEWERLDAKLSRRLEIAAA